MREKIEAALDKLRTILRKDGGDIELVDLSAEGVVKLRFKGACAGCPMSQITLKTYIEAGLKKEVPEVKSVEAVL